MRLSLPLLSLTLALPATAQQFVHVPGFVPGVTNWTEGVELADVDNDGDLDVIFAEGEGFSAPGPKRQNVLLINQLVETGTFSLTDESVARFGANLSNGKGVTTGDVNGDGYLDVLILNGFNTDVPFLYINRGAAQPGYFDLESATRGFTEVLSCASAQFGDLDDDGDLDAILCDSGNSFLSGPGGEPHLYLNDGTGVFTEVSWSPGVKVAHMDVDLIDIDGDWDLDFFGANRATNGGVAHYLMLNDGSANFTDASSLLPTTSGFVYEAEPGDLDGDTDHDLFFLSLSGLQEGYIRNDLVESGALGFTSGSPFSGSVDDNEVTFIDFNVDGRLDVLVASLGSQERIYRNLGGLAFNLNANRITKISDSSLDSAAGDMDNDGDYDIITAQGESNSAQWANKYFENTGNPDDLPPVIMGTDIPAQATAWPAILKVRAQDNVLDDGVDYVTARGYVAPFGGTGGSTELTGGAFSNATVDLVSGESLVLTNNDGVTETFTAVGTGYPFEKTLVSGQSAEHVFLVPGSYTIEAGLAATSFVVNVTGSPTELTGFRMGGGQHRFAVEEQAPVASETFAVELVLEDWPGNETWLQNQLVLYPGNLGSNYCGPAVPNSTGSPGEIRATGSDAVADDEFYLVAESLPPNQFGYFLTSATQGFAANPGGSQGNLCLGGTIGRFVKQVSNSGSAGTFTIEVDLSKLPAPLNVAVQAGDTWNFTTWFRDKNPSTTSNFTDGVSVLFQ